MMTNEIIQNVKEISEKCFENYLIKHGLEYIKDYPVEGGEIDFLVKQHDTHVYCDVKALLETVNKLKSSEVAIKRMRNDIDNLRKKFRKSKPDSPCVLVSMNFSNNMITGLPIATAMYGELIISFDRNTTETIRPLHHSPKGKAKMTTMHNKSISGIFCFNFDDRAESFLFHNEFAKNPLPQKFFPSTTDIYNTRDKTRDNLGVLGRVFFNPYRG